MGRVNGRSVAVIGKGLVKGGGRFKRIMSALPPDDFDWVRQRAISTGRPWSDAHRDIIAEARARAQA